MCGWGGVGWVLEEWCADTCSQRQVSCVSSAKNGCLALPASDVMHALNPWHQHRHPLPLNPAKLRPLAQSHSHPCRLPPNSHPPQRAHSCCPLLLSPPPPPQVHAAPYPNHHPARSPLLSLPRCTSHPPQSSYHSSCHHPAPPTPTAPARSPLLAELLLHLLERLLALHPLLHQL